LNQYASAYAELVSTTKPHEKLVKELAAEQEMQVDSAQFDVKLFEQRAITA
jgi:hypothetical protein